MVFVQLLFNSLIIGSIYALVASGFSLIWTTNKFAHFAHGASVSLSAYILFTSFTLWNIPFFLSAIITVILAAGIGVLMNQIIYSPLQKRKSSNIADNQELAKIMGINSAKIKNYSFMIGSALAGVAGILIALEQNIEHSMGTMLMIKGFAGAVIGGVTSVPASILGSYVLGIAENFGIWYLPSGWKDAIAFVLLFLFLLFRPTGILGLNKGVKE
jgi:branched-chain amino acid transport system permease protein